MTRKVRNVTVFLGDMLTIWGSMNDELNNFVTVNYKSVFRGCEIIWACEPVCDDIQKGG